MHNVTAIVTPGHTVFYPIGNTPAVNLLGYHSPKTGQDDATEILLLACGDPRSILYSLWCEGKCEDEKFNFTCCDLEPAVLARNVLLLSLILDNSSLYNEKDSKKLASIWNIFYHFFISKEDLALVREQSLKLLDYSETPEKWAAGPYSSINFISQQTIAQLQTIWTLYSETRTEIQQRIYDSARRAEIKHQYDKTYGIGGKSYTFYAGPHWQDGIDTMNHSLRGYWSTGVVGGNPTDVKNLGDKKGTSNPLIMVSSISEEFIVHFTIDPLTSFHLTEVFDREENTTRDVLAMIALAKKQFREWCKAFSDYASYKNVQVNFYYGEAITFCHELAARNDKGPSAAGITRAYAAQWSSKPLSLEGEAGKTLPLFFDVIDTSNLIDWVGLINVLPPMTQLIAPRSTSVLWTESFRLFAYEPKDDLYESLFMDISLASVLIGIAPLGHLLGYAMDNTTGEDVVHGDNANRYRMRIPWKVSIDHDTMSSIINNPQDYHIHFDSGELAEIFFEVYLKMFESEDLEKSKSERSKRRPLNSRVFNRYSRLSFATLIQHVLGRTITDEKAFLKTLRAKIIADETLHMGSEYVGDIINQLVMSGTIPNPIAATSSPAIQPFTCVTLVVPRAALKPITKRGGAPGIQLSIEKGKKKESTSFLSIDCFFGSVKQDEEGNWSEIIEDPRGISGLSDLIVTTPVPAELVAEGTGTWTCFLLITLSIHAAHYIEELGPSLTVFSASSKSKKQLFTSRVPPGSSPRRKPEELFNVYKEKPAEDQKEITISASRSTGPLILQAKYSLAPDSDEATALGKAAFVTLTDASPCSILLNIGDSHSRRLIFPYPINTAKLKTRIARKSLWIEVSVPVAAAITPGGYDTSPFPVVIEAGKQPASWALPRIDLSKQPKITGNVDEWTNIVLHQYTSQRECSLIDDGPKSVDFHDVLPFYKVRQSQMLSRIAANPQNRLFLFRCKSEERGSLNNYADMYFIANTIRHARETGGLIVDGWIYLLNNDFDQSTPSAKKLKRAVETKKAISYDLRKADLMLWKQLLPAAVESCRRNWEHKDACEYLVQGKVPVSVKLWEQAVCSCGHGMDVEEFPSSEDLVGVKQWATRVAFPTLSAAPYVEATGNFDS